MKNEMGTEDAIKKEREVIASKVRSLLEEKEMVKEENNELAENILNMFFLKELDNLSKENNFKHEVDISSLIKQLSKYSYSFNNVVDYASGYGIRIGDGVTVPTDPDLKAITIEVMKVLGCEPALATGVKKEG